MNWVEIIGALSCTYQSECEVLNQLDSALGDGDHGTALSVAFKEAAEKTVALFNPLPTAVLQVVANTLMNRMGGSAGALYGTLFLRASTIAKDKTELTGNDLAAMLRSGLEGVMQRGKAQLGDKTMVDALAPAADAFRISLQSSPSLSTAFEQAAAAARAGAQATANLVAKQGRAKFVGERSLGHVDAGAASVALMFETLRDYWKEQGNAKT